MPYIFFNPSSNKDNRYTGGGTEKYYMNLIADYMIPYLRANDIRFTRNGLNESIEGTVNKANNGDYDLYLSFNSAQSTSAEPGRNSGINIYYYDKNDQAKRAAEIFENQLKSIYIDPESIRLIPTDELDEVVKTKAPAVVLEITYFDDCKDAKWLRNNLNKIAETIVKAITEIFGINFVSPQPSRTGIVVTESGPLNIRALPNTDSEILATIPKGAKVEVLATFDGWYVVLYNGVEGYSKSDYIQLS